jgi:hypothetical protein
MSSIVVVAKPRAPNAVTAARMTRSRVRWPRPEIGADLPTAGAHLSERSATVEDDLRSLGSASVGIER